MIKERVQDLCKERGITVKKLEEILGLGNGAIGKWDKFKPKSDNLEKTADFFGVTTDYLLGRSIAVKEEISLNTSHIDKALNLLSKMDEKQQKTAVALLTALVEDEKDK